MLHTLIKPFVTPKLELCGFPDCSMLKKRKESYLLGQIGCKQDKTYCHPDVKEAGIKYLSCCVDCIIDLFKEPQAMAVAWQTFTQNPLLINCLKFKARMSAAQTRRGLQKDEQMTVADDAQMEILQKIDNKKLSAQICEEEISSKHHEIEALKTSRMQLDNGLWSKVNPTHLKEWGSLSKKYKTQCPNRILQGLNKDLAGRIKLVKDWEENQMQWLLTKLDNCVNKLSQLGYTGDGKPKVKELRREKSVGENTDEQTTMKEPEVESQSPSMKQTSIRLLPKSILEEENPDLNTTTVGGRRTFGKETDTDTIVYDLALEVQNEKFQLLYRYNDKVKPVDNAPIVQGWDKRLCEYSYAKSKKSNYQQVYQDTTPVIDEIKSITHRYDWHKVVSSDIDGSDLQRLVELTKWIFKWGGIKPKDYSQIWKVIKTALTWSDEFGAPMDSGWTKLASFATATLAKGKQQVIWDSRVSHSITRRLDRLLDDRGIVVSEMKDIGTVPGRGGTRGRSALKLKWPNGYRKWEFHFAGSRLVHQMVGILNNNQRDFPRMPHPNKGDVDWDVWGVGLVLFMDGY